MILWENKNLNHVHERSDAGITGFCCIGPATREIKSARTVLIKSLEFQLFTSTILAVFFIAVE